MSINEYGMFGDAFTDYSGVFDNRELLEEINKSITPLFRPSFTTSQLFKKNEGYGEPIWNFFHPQINVRTEMRNPVNAQRTFPGLLSGTEYSYIKPCMYDQVNYLLSEKWRGKWGEKENVEDVVDSGAEKRKEAPSLETVKIHLLFEEVFSPSFFCFERKITDPANDICLKVKSLEELSLRELESLDQKCENVKIEMLKTKKEAVQQLEECLDRQTKKFSEDIHWQVKKKLEVLKNEKETTGEKEIDQGSEGEEEEEEGEEEEDVDETTQFSNTFPLGKLVNTCIDSLIVIFSFMETRDLLLNVSLSSSFFRHYIKKNVPIKVVLGKGTIVSHEVDEYFKDQRIKGLSVNVSSNESWSNMEFTSNKSFKNSERLLNILTSHASHLKELDVIGLETNLIKIPEDDEIIKIPMITKRLTIPDQIIEREEKLIELSKIRVKKLHSLYFDYINEMPRLESLFSTVLPERMTNLNNLRKIIFPIDINQLIYSSTTSVIFRTIKCLETLTDYFLDRKRTKITSIKFFSPKLRTITTGGWFWNSNDVSCIRGWDGLLTRLYDSVSQSCTNLEHLQIQLLRLFHTFSFRFITFLTSGKVKKVDLTFFSIPRDEDFIGDLDQSPQGGGWVGGGHVRNEFPDELELDELDIDNFDIWAMAVDGSGVNLHCLLFHFDDLKEKKEWGSYSNNQLQLQNRDKWKEAKDEDSNNDMKLDEITEDEERTYFSGITTGGYGWGRDRWGGGWSGGRNDKVEVMISEERQKEWKKRGNKRRRTMKKGGKKKKNNGKIESGKDNLAMGLRDHTYSNSNLNRAEGGRNVAKKKKNILKKELSEKDWLRKREELKNRMEENVSLSVAKLQHFRSEMINNRRRNNNNNNSGGNNGRIRVISESGYSFSTFSNVESVDDKDTVFMKELVDIPTVEFCYIIRDDVKSPRHSQNNFGTERNHPDDPTGLITCLKKHSDARNCESLIFEVDFSHWGDNISYADSYGIYLPQIELMKQEQQQKQQSEIFEEEEEFESDQQKHQPDVFTLGNFEMMRRKVEYPEDYFQKGQVMKMVISKYILGMNESLKRLKFRLMYRTRGSFDRNNLKTMEHKENNPPKPISRGSSGTGAAAGWSQHADEYKKREEEMNRYVDNMSLEELVNEKRMCYFPGLLFDTIVENNNARNELTSLRLDLVFERECYCTMVDVRDFFDNRVIPFMNVFGSEKVQQQQQQRQNPKYEKKELVVKLRVKELLNGDFKEFEEMNTLLGKQDAATKLVKKRLEKMGKAEYKRIDAFSEYVKEKMGVILMSNKEGHNWGKVEMKFDLGLNERNESERRVILVKYP